MVMQNILKNSRSFLGATLLLGAALLSSCVTGPNNNDWVDPSAVDFTGYAQNPGATIEIQALDKITSVWITVSTTTARTSPTNYGGETLYYWSDLDTDTLVSGQCIWGDGSHPNCSIPAGSASATFRVREVGGNTMVTFEDDGVACVVNEVDSGSSWFAAGNTCKSGASPNLTLRWLT